MSSDAVELDFLDPATENLPKHEVACKRFEAATPHGTTRHLY